MASRFVSVKHAFDLPVGSEITLRGWVRSRRDSKGITFIELNDGSRFKSRSRAVVEDVAMMAAAARAVIFRARQNQFEIRPGLEGAGNQHFECLHSIRNGHWVLKVNADGYRLHCSTEPVGD